MPLPAAVPMSKVVVPNSDPEPVFKPRAIGKFAGRPTVEKFPYGSRVLMTGCVAKVEPTLDTPPGCVAKMSRSAAAGPTTTLSEVALVKPVAEKTIVIVSATL
jgi:hypothetical protein